MTSLTSDQPSADSYQYDPNGNMTCRTENEITYRQAYNAENRISSIAKMDGDCETGTILEVWAYAYDGDGTRVSTAHFTGLEAEPDSFTAYYMGGAYEVKDGAVKKYYSIAGMTVAMNDGMDLEYLLTDQLGSVVAITDENGGLVEQQRYLPFGGVRTDLPSSTFRLTETDFTYTGQRNVTGTGLMDYKARFYDPYITHFSQPDTIIPSLYNPQSLNRYTYALNNPIRYTDPTGHHETACASQNDPDCSAVNGGDTGNTHYKDDPCVGMKALVLAICRRGEEAQSRKSKDSNINTELTKAGNGDPWAILGLIIPTHMGLRIQGEVTFAPPWLPPWAGFSLTIPGINILYHRPENSVILFIDGGASGGGGFTGGKVGIGGSVTGGLLIGWGSSQSSQVTSGWSSQFNASAHAEESYAGTVSSNLETDKRYGIKPTTIYAGTGAGCCYASIGTGASYAIPIGSLKLPDSFRGIVGMLMEQHAP